jgi:hypothetical protein
LYYYDIRFVEINVYHLNFQSRLEQNSNKLIIVMSNSLCRTLTLHSRKRMWCFLFFQELVSLLKNTLMSYNFTKMGGFGSIKLA